MSANCTTITYDASLPSHFTKTEQLKAGNHSSSICSSPVAQSTEEDVRADVHSKIVALKRKFHRDRKLLVKHLPRNVVKQEIAHLLADFSIESIQLSSNDDQSSTATVTLEHPEVLDDWNCDRTFLLRGQSVSVSPTSTEMVLCVAKLPFHYDESNFHDLVKGFGEIKMYFLMVSEKTGKSKGYGFVQYANKESALNARNALNDRVVDAFQLVCDWLDSSHSTFKSLHSTCLYVDRLPRQFRDMGEFRAIFEKYVSPPYCQIALKNGCPLDWGLVEYLSADDAELAQISCNNHRLRNQTIRVVYFIPGVRAITLMLSLLDTPARGKSTGLLPDPTGQSIRTSIENLSKQNPIFAENLKSIILHQIQESKHAKDEANGVGANTVAVKVPVEPKSSDVVVVVGPQHCAKEMERIIPPTPPMTPTIVSALPLVGAAGGLSPAVSLLPNTSVPPPLPSTPCVDKASYPPVSAAAAFAVGLKDKLPIAWNDLLAQPAFANGFVPAVAVPPPPPSSTADAFAARSAQLAANFVPEMANVPPWGVQPNGIFNMVNGSPMVTLPVAVSAASPNAVVPAQLQTAPAFSFAPFATVDAASWLLPKMTDALVGGPASVVTLPFAAAKSVPPSWLSAVASFVPATGVPVFAADWPNVRVHPKTAMGSPVAGAISQPGIAPVAHYYAAHQAPLAPPPQHHHFYAAGQKRKLLPSPEKSPEGNYIGQHSQGIGGHYADSYFKKKKMF